MPIDPTAPIVISALHNTPAFTHGLVRALRVRWALEEVGQPYDVRPLSFPEMKAAAHLAVHPFGQIPTYQDGDLALFESGAIVFHIAQRHAGLLPADPDARARVLAWMFAAVATLQPPIVELGMASLFERDEPWFEARQAMLERNVRTRLEQLSARLGDADWLDGDFSAGDLMMVTVLRRLGSSGVLESYPSLLAYISRAEVRPAWRRAYAEQAAVFAAASAG